MELYDGEGLRWNPGGAHHAEIVFMNGSGMGHRGCAEWQKQRPGLMYRWLLILTCVAQAGCALAPVETIEIGDLANCSRKVLIATQQSPFKESIVVQVTDALKEDACYIRVVDLTELEAQSPEEYTAVIIANTCIAWRLNPLVKGFLKGVKARERVFLITTANGEECEEPPMGVDAVTAASKTGRSSQIAQEIVEKVQELLK